MCRPPVDPETLRMRQPRSFLLSARGPALAGRPGFDPVERVDGFRVPAFGWAYRSLTISLCLEQRGLEQRVISCRCSTKRPQKIPGALGVGQRTARETRELMARVAILHQPPRPSDPAEYFGNDAAIAAYMTEALETDDPSFIGDGLGVVARAVR